MKKNEKRSLGIILFWIYVVAMVWLMFLQRLPSIFQDGSFENYGTQIILRLKLVPFETIKEFWNMLERAWSTHAFINLVGNVLMFVPLGYGLPFLSKQARSFLGCMIVSFFVILIAEMIQLFTLLGYFDIDDFILNLIGVAVGFFTQALINRHFNIRSK